MENAFGLQIFASDSTLRVASHKSPASVLTEPCDNTFRPITADVMPLIWKYLQCAPGRTTDYSYGGVLMWIEYFDYQYCIYKDTLFIKGKVENDRSLTAFSHPVGALPLKESVDFLRQYCAKIGIRLIFSAIPADVIEDYRQLQPQVVTEIKDWGDYLYDARMLSTLSGKKMSKKRNHVNAFISGYPDWRLEEISADNCLELESFMDRIEQESATNENARAERELTRHIVREMADGHENVLQGSLLRVGGEICAFTIGDVKGDTLFVHIEKALREVRGSYEAINKMFVEQMLEKEPSISYVNREDDAGDLGLRMAKESYHPLEILKKYNVVF